MAEICMFRAGFSSKAPPKAVKGPNILKLTHYQYEWAILVPEANMNAVAREQRVAGAFARGNFTIANEVGVIPRLERA